jgi:hypothetical protein
MNAPSPPILDRASVLSAIADYLLEANHNGYRPDPSKVLSVRKDRLASLREAAPPVRGEVSYFIEGELFAVSGQTRLRIDETVATAAERLVGEVWDRLWVWNAYDFSRSTSGWRAP